MVNLPSCNSAPCSPLLEWRHVHSSKKGPAAKHPEHLQYRIIKVERYDLFSLFLLRACSLTVMVSRLLYIRCQAGLKGPVGEP